MAGAAGAVGEDSGAASFADQLTAPDEAVPLQVIAAQLRRCFAKPGAALYDELEQLIVTEAYRHYGLAIRCNRRRLLGVTRNVLRTLLKRHGLLEDSAISPLDHGWLPDAARI